MKSFKIILVLFVILPAFYLIVSKITVKKISAQTCNTCSGTWRDDLYVQVDCTGSNSCGATGEYKTGTKCYCIYRNSGDTHPCSDFNGNQSGCQSKPSCTWLACAPTPTPVPLRPNWCQSARFSDGTKNSTMSYNGSLTINSIANTNAVTKFYYYFYNLDNLHPVGELYYPGPRNIQFVANTNYGIINTVNPTNQNSVTFKYSDIYKPDLWWGGKYPVHIQVNAYYGDNAGRFSNADANCVVSFTVANPPSTATPTPTPTGTTGVPQQPAGCACGTADLCNGSCTNFQKLSDPALAYGYTPAFHCSMPAAYYTSAPEASDKDNNCKRALRGKGASGAEALTSSKIGIDDYMYYVQVVNGGKVPPGINVDFNGDGDVSPKDRAIIWKTWKAGL